jgi:AraC-like DNA-binding protein
MLFTKNGNTYLNKLLAALMLMRGLQMVYFIAVNTGQFFFVSLLFKSLDPIIFVNSAFLYLYVRGYLKDEVRLRKNDLLHLIPFLFAFINILPWYFLDAPFRKDAVDDMISQQVFFIDDSFGVFPIQVILLFRIGIILIYLFLTWRMVVKSGIIKNRRNHPIVSHWILFFVIIATFSNFIFIVNAYIYIVSGALIGNLFFINYMSYISSAILLAFFGYIFYNPEVLYGCVFVAKNFLAPIKLTGLDMIESEKIEELIENQQNIEFTAARKQAPTFRDEEIGRFKTQMIRLMETEMPFLNPDFALADLANQMGLPNHHCSYILNEYFGKNFREWVNSYRVDFFISHFPGLIATQTIVSIALSSGFKNKNTFYTAFEKGTGKTPSQYFN